MTPPNLSVIPIMICFWVTLWLVHRFLIKPISQVLDERRQRIDSAEDEWSSKNEDYLSATSRLETEMEEAAREASAVRSEHIQQAMDSRTEKLAEVREQADQRLQTALDELTEDAGKARTELRASAQELARTLAGKLLQREVAP